jgi:formylglycine-generating enzyme required for sulfatase activity
MKKVLVAATLSVMAVAAFATTAVIREGSVKASQNASHRVIVDYTLDNGPAIVTFDVLTNGVSIGERHLTEFSGDVNRKVDSGAHTFHWLPVKCWPGHVFPAGGDVEVTVKVVAWDLNCAPDVMVIDLLAKSNVTYFASLEGLPGGVQDEVYKTDKLVLRKIPAEYVEWKMGAPSSQSGYNKWVDTQHQVTLTRDYYMGVYEVTQKQWYNISGTKPSHFTNSECWATRPVEKVAYSGDFASYSIRGNSTSWPNGSDVHEVKADSFFGKLRAHSGLELLDLPTDAQWEYACRAGCGGVYYLPDLAYGDESASKLARYYAEGYVDGVAPQADCTTESGTAAVGSYVPNAWGLYDTLGNVREWCLDVWQDNLGTDSVINPVGSASSSYHRVYRGGSWCDYKQVIRCGSRASYPAGASTQENSSVQYWVASPYIGFRVCLHLQ